MSTALGLLLATGAYAAGGNESYLTQTGQGNSADIQQNGGPAIQFPFRGVTGYTQSQQLGNPELRPESTVEDEIGLELRFLGSRLRADVSASLILHSGKIVTLGLHPAVELRVSRQPEPIEERPGVDGDRPLEIAGGAHLLELIHVAVDHQRLEPELADSRNRLRRPEVSAERIEGVVESIAPSFFGAVGPEQREETLARRSAFARTCQHREDREPAGLCRGARHRSAVLLHGQPAERANSQHENRLVGLDCPAPGCPERPGEPRRRRSRQSFRAG